MMFPKISAALAALALAFSSAVPAADAPAAMSADGPNAEDVSIMPGRMDGMREIVVDAITVRAKGREKKALSYNGHRPGEMVLRFKEGETAKIRVTNKLDRSTSIHWHGLILPFTQDGVPGISFDGIAPGESFDYEFPLVQSGTYWFHSHSGMQEQDGAYGALVIEPKEREPFRYDREHVLVLSDLHPHNGERILSNLKRMPDYYNRHQETLGDFFRDAGEKGLGAAARDRAEWGMMRMMKTDISDVHGYDFLINGRAPEENWTALFKPGERVRLRIVNAAAMTYFDFRIPGLKLLVVQADGNNVRPVEVDEMRIAVSETYDVIVRPEEERPYALFAEPMARTGFAFGTLAPRDGMRAEIPERRPPPKLTMADMRLAHGMGGMNHGDDSHAGMGHDGHDMSHSASASPDEFYAPGSGLTPTAANGGKFLSYSDLRAQKPLYPDREPTREIEMRLTGNMERYTWSINGVKYSDAEPLRLKRGERVRFKFVNETMMTHPMHLHGMWTIVDAGGGAYDPVKHVVSVAPGTTVYTETEVDAPGKWAFHCHLMYHMASGMFRKVIVEEDDASVGAESGGRS